MVGGWGGGWIVRDLKNAQSFNCNDLILFRFRRCNKLQFVINLDLFIDKLYLLFTCCKSTIK